MALIRTMQAIANDQLQGDNDDKNIGIKITLDAMQRPLREIINNAGEDASVILNEVRNGEGVFGYNAQTEE